jgi:DNA-binding NarL/FixJ family response regulator
VRVLIAEDQVLLREGLARLFEDGGHEVAASLGSAHGLPAAIAEHEPDLVVLDIRMPPTFTDESARAAKEIKRVHPNLGVLLLSQHVETTHAVQLVTLGGFGYLLKDRVLDVAEFLSTAERVAQGGSALDPKVVASLVSTPGDGDQLAQLTDREREVLELMAEGLTNTGIATRLYLSERTVEAHVRHVLMKLGIAESEHGHRRVLAVLTHLSATPDAVAPIIRRQGQPPRQLPTCAAAGSGAVRSSPSTPTMSCRSGWRPRASSWSMAARGASCRRAARRWITPRGARSRTSRIPTSCARCMRPTSKPAPRS